jgi:hypothetical protein
VPEADTDRDDPGGERPAAVYGAQIDAALVRAGVMPPQRSLQQTRTVKGGRVAAVGTIGAGAIGTIQETIGQAHDALVGVVPYLDAAKWGLLAVTLIGIGVMLWARIDDRRMGLRRCGCSSRAGCFAMCSRSWGGLPPQLPSPRFSSAPGKPAAMPSVSRTCGELWRCNVTSSRLRAVVLAIAASLLAGCATERSDGSPCPPVVDYSPEFLARATVELDSLPIGSAIEQMLVDYQVMRDQARACGQVSSASAETIARMERGMETFQRDYELVEDGYKNHLDMKANSEASLPQSERMPSAENRFHAYLLASAISPPR